MRVVETAETDSIIMGQPGSKVQVGKEKSLTPISSVEHRGIAWEKVVLMRS